MNTQIVDFGHFGGGRGSTWTQDFTNLIARRPSMELFADLGYWEELMCSEQPSAECIAARERLAAALRMPLSTGSATVLDRTMVASDWLMLSQVKQWAAYPTLLHASLRQILGNDEDVAKVFGGNAMTCFRL